MTEEKLEERAATNHERFFGDPRSAALVVAAVAECWANGCAQGCGVCALEGMCRDEEKLQEWMERKATEWKKD